MNAIVTKTKRHDTLDIVPIITAFGDRAIFFFLHVPDEQRSRFPSTLKAKWNIPTLLSNKWMYLAMKLRYPKV